MGFLLVPESVTLNDLHRRTCRYNNALSHSHALAFKAVARFLRSSL